MYSKLLVLLALISTPSIFSGHPHKKPNPYVNPATMTMDRDGHEDCIGKIEKREQHERKMQWKKFYRNKNRNNEQQKIRAEKLIMILAKKAAKTKAQQTSALET